jgi:nicotinamide-nucleotide amidase
MDKARNRLRAALVSVGDELLSGRTVDTNGAWLGRELARLGVPVARRYTVGDAAAEIQEAVAGAAACAELVIVTGGLGPTPDDVTRDAVAALTARPLREDAEVLARIQELFRERGGSGMAAPNRRVAQVPDGATKLANERGTAPGLAMEHGASVVVLLPGVPREMRGIFRGPLTALLEARFEGRLRPVHVRLLHTTGIPESRLAEEVARCLPDGTGPVDMAFLPDLRGVDLRLSASDMTGEEADRRFEAIEKALQGVLEPWRYDAPGGDLAEAVSTALRASQATLAVAESCTGGLIGKRLTDLPGASDVFPGGVIAYSNDVKVRVLGVAGDVLAAEGAVAGPVAARMAREAARRCGAEAGIGVTGVAGPGGGSAVKPVGTVWYAAFLRGRVATRAAWFAGDREAIREQAAQAALFLLLRLLDGRETPDP